MEAFRHRAVLLAALLACVLSGCGDKGDGSTERTAVYEFGGEKIVAFGAEDGLLPQREDLVYTYSGLDKPQPMIREYLSMLTDEEHGFFVVDEAFVKSEFPSFDEDVGSVFLARDLPASEGKDDENGSGGDADAEESAENLLLTLRSDWTPDTCTITLALQTGEITNPPPEPQGMTMAEATEYVMSISPSSFGLSGTNMESYHFYIMSGITFVDDSPCMRLKIYDGNTPEETNHFLGIYFLSSDGQHLYQLNQAAQTVEELPLSMAGG